MSTEASTLPAGWSRILDEVQARLTTAIAAADARIEEMPAVGAESLAQERRADYAYLELGRHAQQSQAKHS